MILLTKLIFYVTQHGIINIQHVRFVCRNQWNDMFRMRRHTRCTWLWHSQRMRPTRGLFSCLPIILTCFFRNCIFSTEGFHLFIKVLLKSQLMLMFSVRWTFAVCKFIVTEQCVRFWSKKGLTPHEKFSWQVIFTARKILNRFFYQLHVGN
jgi:hypothetical protein